MLICVSMVYFIAKLMPYLFLKVHKALPGSSFNSLLLNRYKGSNDYVGWHSDDESFMVRPWKLHLFLLVVNVSS